MIIEARKVEDLLSYENNARIHSPDQIIKLSASINEFGFNNPILIDDKGEIIAGHGRLEAAKDLNIESVPTITLSHLNEAQKKAYCLADNRLAEVGASWDMELVEIELNNIINIAEDFDVGLTGFDLSMFDDDQDNEPDDIDYEEKLELVVKCDSEGEQELLFERLTEEGYTCHVLGI